MANPHCFFPVNRVTFPPVYANLKLSHRSSGVNTALAGHGARGPENLNTLL